MAQNEKEKIPTIFQLILLENIVELNKLLEQNPNTLRK